MSKTPPTRNCGDCRLADWTDELKLKCTKGHSPRFYLPRHGPYPHDTDFGYKRRCADFQEGLPAGITQEKMDTNILEDKRKFIEQVWDSPQHAIDFCNLLPQPMKSATEIVVANIENGEFGFASELVELFGSLNEDIEEPVSTKEPPLTITDTDKEAIKEASKLANSRPFITFAP